MKIIININKKTNVNPASIYLLKVNCRNNRKEVWNMFKVNSKETRTTMLIISSFWKTGDSNN